MNHVITLLSLHKKQRREIMEKEKLVDSLETCEERIQRKKSDFKKGVRKKYNMTLKDLSNKEIDEIMKAIENLEYEIYSDSYLMEIILTGAADYGNGDETLDSAVEKAMNKLNIYPTE